MAYGIATSNRARAVGINVRYANNSLGQVKYLPQNIVVVGLGNTGVTYTTDRVQVFSATEVGNLYGFGSPLYAAVAALFPQGGSGMDGIPVYVHPLQAAGGATAATATILPAVTTITKIHEVRLVFGGVSSNTVAITVGMTALQITTALVAAINAVAAMPVTAVDGAALGVQVTSKWKGASANLVSVKVDTTSGLGVSYTGPTVLSGGTADPAAAAVTTALQLTTDVWTTAVVNTLGNATGILDALAAFGEGRWAPTVRKPMYSFWGTAEPVVTTAYGITTTRRSDRTNSCIPAPGSISMPWVIAAAAAKAVCKQANLSPAMGYALTPLEGVIPGPDSAQWDGDKREAALQNGLSSTIVQDGFVVLSDTITSYRPVGEDPPGYQYVVDLNKLGTAVYSLNAIFSSREWAEAPLVPDGTPTTEPNAKKPCMAKGEVGKLLASLADAAIIQEPVETLKNTYCGIATGGKRLEVAIPIILSGNTNVVNVDLSFGFGNGSR